MNIWAKWVSRIFQSLKNIAHEVKWWNFVNFVSKSKEIEQSIKVIRLYVWQFHSGLLPQLFITGYSNAAKYHLRCSVRFSVNLTKLGIAYFVPIQYLVWIQSYLRFPYEWSHQMSFKFYVYVKIGKISTLWMKFFFKIFKDEYFFEIFAYFSIKMIFFWDFECFNIFWGKRKNTFYFP